MVFPLLEATGSDCSMVWEGDPIETLDDKELIRGCSIRYSPTSASAAAWWVSFFASASDFGKIISPPVGPAPFSTLKLQMTVLSPLARNSKTVRDVPDSPPSSAVPYKFPA